MNEYVSLSSYSKTSLPGRMDFVQAISGALLAIFTLMHLLFVSTVLISPSLMNGLGWLLEELYLAQIGGPLILLIMVIHFIIAARKMPFHVGSLQLFFRHAKAMRHCDTSLWLVQVITAIMLLVMVTSHIFVVLSALPITAESSALREQSGWSPFYVVLLICVGLHLSIGLFRIGVKYGYITESTRSLWTKRTWYLIFAYVGLGLLTMVRFHFINVN